MRYLQSSCAVFQLQRLCVNDIKPGGFCGSVDLFERGIKGDRKTSVCAPVTAKYCEIYHENLTTEHVLPYAPKQARAAADHNI